VAPDDLLAAVGARFGDDAAQIEYGTVTVDVEPAAWIDTLKAARDELGCTFFDWLCGVDELDDGIGVVAHVYSRAEHHHLLLRTRVPRHAAVLPTATSIFRGANWHERETAEMFGVDFAGHPNLVPLLLPEGFEGTPLRKDFVLASRVAKQWPGEVDPGQSAGELAPNRRRNLPPGVPDPKVWGPGAGTG